MLLEKYKYIVIEGNIGAGKTSLAKKLNYDFGGNLVLEEFAENTFLPLFYENPTKYAFPLEFSFLAARFQQLKNLFDNQNNKTIISDYHFHKTLIFAKANLDTAELKLFESFFNIISIQIPDPDIVVYLKKGVKHLQDNISRRGRDFENGISSQYLKKINEGYQQLLINFPTSKVLQIESENLDFIKNEEDYYTIINLINKA